ncbi:MAG: DUF2784 family protein [Nitrospinales bacterium]
MRDVILGIHFLVILFLVAGFPYGLITNKRGFRLFHGGVLGVVISLMILRIPCPITVLEKAFMDDSYRGTFIGHWLDKVVYVGWMPPTGVFIMDLSFAVLVFSSFYWRPLSAGKGKKPDAG